MIELTPEQHQLLERSGKAPARAVDPADNTEYVLLRVESYERIKSLLGDAENWADDAYQAALEVFARDGWNDPRMDVYDSLDPRRPK